MPRSFLPVVYCVTPWLNCNNTPLPGQLGGRHREPAQDWQHRLYGHPGQHIQHAAQGESLSFAVACGGSAHATLCRVNHEGVQARLQGMHARPQRGGNFVTCTWLPCRHLMASTSAGSAWRRRCARTWRSTPPSHASPSWCVQTHHPLYLELILQGRAHRVSHVSMGGQMYLMGRPCGW